MSSCLAVQANENYKRNKQVIRQLHETLAAGELPDHNGITDYEQHRYIERNAEGFKHATSQYTHAEVTQVIEYISDLTGA
jgi:hypothetical protein